MNRERLLFSGHYLVPDYPSQLCRYRKHRDRSATTLDASLRRWPTSLAGYTRWPFVDSVWGEK